MTKLIDILITVTFLLWIVTLLAALVGYIHGTQIIALLLLSCIPSAAAGIVKLFHDMYKKHEE